MFVRGARQLLTLRGPVPRRGLSCAELGLIPDGSLLIEGGRIEEVGPTRRIENLRKARNARLIDVRGKVVTPGLVDSHMRPSGGSPALELFERRIAGLDALRSSGAPPGLAIRPETGSDRAKHWLRLALVGGATFVEAHSGRELPPTSELRALRILAKSAGEFIELSVGFSAVAPTDARMSEQDREAAAVRLEEVLDRASVTPRAARVFRLDCGEGWFDRELALRSAKFAGSRAYLLKVSASGGRLNAGVRFAVEVGALSAEGLDAAAEGDIDLLAASSTVATLFPNLALHRGGGRFPPARRLLDRGAAVSLASGFSPDLHPGFSLQMAMALACREMRLMPEEAIACCTINAAVAVGRAATIGSLEPNKQADLAVFDVADYREIPYYFGVNLCWMTMKRGRVVYRAGVQHARSPWDGEQ